MSRVLAVAREDLRHALRDRLLWGATLLLGLIFLPSTANSATSQVRPAAEHVPLLALDLLTYTLVVVAAVGYAAVVGEREAGTDRLVLGLPATRRDLVVGKLLSRTAVVVAVVGAVLVVADALFLVGYGDAHLALFWTMGAGMLAYAAVWTAVTVGYSAAFDSRYRVLGALVATYGVFGVTVNVWGVVVEPLLAVPFTGSVGVPAYETAPLWLQVVERLNPMQGFFETLQWALAAVGPGTPETGAGLALFGAGTFLAFGAVPLWVGLRRFDRADLTDGADGAGAGDRLWRAVRRHTPRMGSGGASAGASRAWTVARADLRHAVQNWVVAGAVGLLVVLVVPDLWTGVEVSEGTTADRVVRDLPLTFLLPTLVLAVAVGYRAVVGEREAGTDRLVLGLPVTRRDLVVGKACSRVAIAVGALVPLVTVAELLVAVRLPDPHVGAFLAWGSYLLVFAAAWTAFVVGVSAAVSTRYRALATVFATYVLFSPSSTGLWDLLVRPLFSMPFTGRFATPEGVHAVNVLGPVWYRYLDGLNPIVALGRMQDLLLGLAGAGPLYGTAPLYAYSVAVVALFASLPLYVGYRRFDRADLG
ncbi:ABC transporter permease [Halorarius halobius]|uniref:ABC transporter permease n=1 Tax=Halorarius halobius TaxID=2962671 RepID=UPI0020CCF19E|nr:ABC transporter permease subunit [Halorarius halobius]